MTADTSQSGDTKFDIEVTSADGTLNYGNFTNALAGGVGKPVSITGDGTLNFVGSTVKLGGAPFPNGDGRGVVRLTSGTLDLNGGTMVVNDLVRDGGTITNSAAAGASVTVGVDGENWFTVGDYGVPPTTNYFTWYNDDKPYAFDVAVNWDSSPFPAGTAIEVRTGATLDCGGLANMVDALRFDASVGGGTITNFAPTVKGTLYLVNVTDDTTRQPFLSPAYLPVPL